MNAATVLMICSLIAATAAAKQSEKKDELNDSVEEELKMMMSEIKNHCGVLNHPKTGSRQKRQSEESLNARLRSSLLECLGRTSGWCDNSTTSGTSINSAETTTTPLETTTTTLLETTTTPLETTTTPLETTTRPPISGPCSSPDTVNLTESWRKDNQGSRILPNNGTYACDRELQLGTIWFRFTGAAGTQLSNRCAPSYSCGSHGGFWSDAQMPSRVGETIRVSIQGSLRGNCNWYTWPVTHPMTVQRCSDRPGDFVYKVHGTGHCSWAFCGMD